MLSQTHLVTGTVTAVTAPEASETSSESVQHPIDANLLPDAQVPRHPECGSHPAAGEEIKIKKWGGRRAGAGRKPASRSLAEARIARSIESLSWPVDMGDRWYCVQTLYRAELVAIQELTKQGYPTFMPRTERMLPDKSRIIVPMFPAYLFVRFNREADLWRPIVSTIGVRSLFGSSPERPIPIPLGIIEEFLARADADGVIVKRRPPAPKPYAVGESLRVLEGPFTSTEGICSLSSGRRVKLLLDLFGRMVEAELDKAAVERVAEPGPAASLVDGVNA